MVSVHKEPARSRACGPADKLLPTVSIHKYIIHVPGYQALATRKGVVHKALEHRWRRLKPERHACEPIVNVVVYVSSEVLHFLRHADAEKMLLRSTSKNHLAPVRYGSGAGPAGAAAANRNP